MRIGVLGGTFNPVHRGHIAIAEEVLDSLPLDRILLVPAGNPPLKKQEDVVSAKHRLEMIRLAVGDHPRLEIWDGETRRAGRSFTVDTMEELERTFPPGGEWFFIMGLDAFAGFQDWHDPKRLSSLCHLVVVSRPGVRFRELAGHPFVHDADPSELARLDDGLSRRYELSLSGESRLILLRVTPWEVSATAIRNHLSGRIRQRNLLPPRVESYIIKNELYLDTESSS